MCAHEEPDQEMNDRSSYEAIECEKQMATYWGDPHIVSLVVMFVPQRPLVFATQT